MNAYELIRRNIAEAESFYDPRMFRDRVKGGGSWDIKLQGPYDKTTHVPLWEDFGNYHYGVTGAVSGLFTLETLLREAGRVQCESGTSRYEWGAPNMGPPYGDQPGDQHWITQGWNDYHAGMYGRPRIGPWGLTMRSASTFWSRHLAPVDPNMWVRRNPRAQ